MAYRQIGSSWNSRMREDIDTMFSELYDEYIGAGLDAAEAKEKASQAVADALIAKEDATVAREMVQQIVDGEVGTGALNTEIERKLNELESQYAPDLNGLKTEVGDARGNEATLGDNLNSIKTDLAQTTLKTLGTVNIKNYEEYKVGDDWTPAWDQLVLDTPEGYTIKFPTDTYYGNFITSKAYEVDFQGSLLIPYLSNSPAIKFEGTIGATYYVSGHPAYGNLGFGVTDATGLSAGDIGYLVDDAIRPVDSTPNVNVELVKIRSVVGNLITVYDIIRSDQNTGNVRFVKVHTIKNPRVKNVKSQPTDEHTQPSIYYFACENAISKNIETENTTGHAIRHELVYGFYTDNPRIIEPHNTGSGSGYGVTAHNSRVGRIPSIYGRGTRHLVDFSSSYNCKVGKVDEEDGKSAVVVLAHNGYGGNNSVEDVTCVTNSYAVNWSAQGVLDRDLQVMRDVRIGKVNHTVPTLKSNESFVSVNIQADYANLLIGAVRVMFVDKSAIPTTNSQAVRLSGNVLGLAKIENIMCNDVGAAVWADVRNSKGRTSQELIVDNVSVDNTVDAVVLRGIYNSKVDNVAVNGKGSAIRAESFNGVSPHILSIGDNILTQDGEIITTSVIPIGLKGKPPKLTNRSTTGLTLVDGNKITMSKILNSGGYLVIVAEISKDTTLHALTPIDPPLWIGQEITLVINGMGDTGVRGSIIIPSGSDTYAGNITLERGNIYRLVGYNGKWKVVA